MALQQPEPLTASGTARFLYDRAREEYGIVGRGWGALTVAERDEFCDVVKPLVPVLEQVRQRVFEIAEEEC